MPRVRPPRSDAWQVYLLGTALTTAAVMFRRKAA